MEKKGGLLGLRVDVAQEMDKWPDPVNALMNLRVPQNVGNFSTGWGTVSFSRKTLLDGAGRSVGALTGWTVGWSVGRLNGYAFRKLTLLPPSGEWLLKHVYQLYGYSVS